jgi:hypothetical protein
MDVEDDQPDESDPIEERSDDAADDDDDDELDGLRIRQLAALRRGAYRVRSYMIVGAGTCAVAAAQLVWMTVASPHSPAVAFGFLLLAILGSFGCAFFIRRIRQISAELEHSRLDAHAMRCVQCGYDVRGLSSGKCPECGAILPTPPPPAEPDFSTLSDGSQQWKNLEDVR